MPHVPRPVTNTSPQMTSVEPTIRVPAWRSASPKKRSTRKPHTLRKTLPVKPAICRPATHSRGKASSRSSLARSKQRGGEARPRSITRMLGQAHHHLITRMFGCVASSIWVNT